MMLKVKVIPNAKASRIQPLSEDCLKAYLTAPPVDGKANKALTEIISEYYKVKKGRVSIIRGKRSQNKIVEIKEE